jgi:hypothetical protein
MSGHWQPRRRRSFSEEAEEEEEEEDSELDVEDSEERQAALLEEDAWERECKLEAWRDNGEAGRVARWTDRATQLLRAEKGAHAALRDASCELRGVDERAAAQEEVDWALDNRVASTSSAASLLRQLPPASSDEEGGVGGAQSRRRVPLRSRRALAATLTQLEAHADCAACCAADTSSSSDSETAPAARVPHCFQDDADNRSGSSSDSGHSDEMACDSLDSDDALPEWRCGQFTAPERYRCIRMPTPEPCSSHEDEGDEGFYVQEQELPTPCRASAPASSRAATLRRACRKRCKSTWTPPWRRWRSAVIPARCWRRLLRRARHGRSSRTRTWRPPRRWLCLARDTPAVAFVCT